MCRDQWEHHNQVDALESLRKGLPSSLTRMVEYWNRLVVLKHRFWTRELRIGRVEFGLKNVGKGEWQVWHFPSKLGLGV